MENKFSTTFIVYSTDGKVILSKAVLDAGEQHANNKTALANTFKDQSITEFILTTKASGTKIYLIESITLKAIYYITGKFLKKEG